MVGPIRDQSGHRRKHRVYETNESAGAISSGLSLASNATGFSTGSTDSTSTVTQDSYSKFKQTGEGRKKTRRRSDSEQQAESVPSDKVIDQEDINVFEFMVEEGVAGVTGPEMEMTDNNNAVTLRQHSPVQAEESDMEGYYRSQMSDSGISMGSSASEHYTDAFTKHALSPLMEEPHDYSVYPPATVDPYYQHDFPVWNPYVGPVYTPEPVPLSPASIRSYPYSQEYRYQGTPEPPSTPASSTACPDFSPLIFRHKGEKDTSPPPVFRTFAKINTRMLMQMQSNITDLEHELSVLDTKITLSEHSTKSRRSEHHSLTRHLSKYQTRRTDLQEELNTSLLEYYDAIETFHKVTQITTPAKSSDKVALKAWLRSHVIPSTRVSPLMGDGSDLVQFGHHRDEISKETLQLIAYCVFTNLLFPLVSFKLTSSVISRLIVLSIVSIVAALALERHRVALGVELGQTFGFCTIACLSVSLLAALLF